MILTKEQFRREIESGKCLEPFWCRKKDEPLNYFNYWVEITYVGYMDNDHWKGIESGLMAHGYHINSDFAIWDTLRASTDKKCAYIGVVTEELALIANGKYGIGVV